MLIGHLPAGYLVAKSLQIRWISRALFFGLILGSPLPDLDMLWFYLVDGRSTHHHAYLTHKPLFWMCFLIVGVSVRHGFSSGIGLGGLLHSALDSISGQVTWGWPITDQPLTLVVVPATQSHWLLSFLVHWTFAVELTLVAMALLVFLLSRRSRRD